jgi:hypothetical protein
VNFSNGSLELHIPLLSYPQRGNLAFSFSARASAKNWMVHQEFNQGGSVISSVWQYAGDGLHVTFDQGFQRRVSKATYTDPNSGNKNNQMTVNLNVLVGSDNSQHPVYGSGAVQYAADGTGMAYNGTGSFDAQGAFRN